MKRIARLVLVSLPLALGSSCQQMLPTAPSDLTTGIVIYRFQDYQGQSAHVTEDISDLDNVDGPCFRTRLGEQNADGWDNCISSVKVAPGWEAHLYEHPDFGGWDQIVLEDVPDLGEVLGPCHSPPNLDNCVSSIRVFRRQVADALVTAGRE